MPRKARLPMPRPRRLRLRLLNWGPCKTVGLRTQEIHGLFSISRSRRGGNCTVDQLNPIQNNGLTRRKFIVNVWYQVQYVTICFYVIFILRTRVMGQLPQVGPSLSGAHSGAGKIRN
ncbi:hypothetical protein SBBP2_3090005 [Burkholderiales bacterium]|nr:hypothetical protein SBBP2_3090005 [Burkholderiales bacterium]